MKLHAVSIAMHETKRGFLRREHNTRHFAGVVSAIDKVSARREAIEFAIAEWPDVDPEKISVSIMEIPQSLLKQEPS